MNNYIFTFLVCLLTFTLTAQPDSIQKDRQLGVSVNPSYAEYLSSIPIAVVITYRINKHQLELGPKFNYMDWHDSDQQFGTEFNYRYYPNGVHNRFNLFFLFNFDYRYINGKYDYTLYTGYPPQVVTVNSKKDSHFFVFNGGYGFQANLFKGIYIGTYIGGGIYTERSHSINSSIEPAFNSSYRSNYKEFSFLLAGSLGFRF